MERWALRVRRDAAEVALARLLDFAPNGVEETDVDADTVEYAIYGDADAMPAPRALEEALGDDLRSLVATTVEDDWADRWREFHTPLVLGDRLSVRPPWEAPIGTAVEIVIDPGRAFGTGAHATTRLCLEALLELDPATAAGSRPGAIDLGCGSGVLAIAAAELGWPSVLALDYDPLSVDATLENAQANSVGDRIEVRRFDLSDGPPPAAPLVLANLLAPLLATWAQQLRAGAPRPRAIVASGILAREAEYIAGLYKFVGFDTKKQLVNAEWAALLLVSRDDGRAAVSSASDSR